jgi:REG-2-like HAD superfamily hydrolase
MSVRAVTWDAVGTLFVPTPSVGVIYAEVASAHGVDADAQRLDERFPECLRTVRARWAVPYGADEQDALRFWNEVITTTFQESLPFELTCDLYDTFARAQRWRVLPGVREALELVHQRRLPQAVVSNYDARLVPLVEELALGPFVAVVPSTLVGRAKPDPTALLLACQSLGVAASEVLHVGDHLQEDGGMCSASGATFLSMRAGAVPLEELRARLPRP